MADSPPPKNDPLDEAFAAYLRTCDAGELSSREEFLAQFPELADELKQLIEAADMFGTSSAPESSVEASHARPGAETIDEFTDDGSGGPAPTLPIASRPAGDRGPTLPFDLGDYLLLEVVGRGGMGVVYLAQQNELDRHVAVKMIRNGMLASDAEVRRFYTEAQAAARLNHPGIVAVHQFGRRAEHHFFSMEYIEGTDLQRVIDGDVIDPTLAARYVRDVARAIHHAHVNGVLHRDLKPANVLIDEEDQVRVTDFGLAKHMDADSSVTGSGAAVGTPHYMAPEQASGFSDRASHRSDVYSLGAILFACVTGRPPIVGDTVMQTLVQVVHDPAPPVRSLRPDVPADLETIIAKCLEKRPEKRYETANELADELDAFLEGRPIAARPRSRVMKMWNWIEGVPLVGALTGRRVLHGSTTHRRIQAAILLLMLLTPIVGVAGFMFWQRQQQLMPRVVRFAGGVDRGLYNRVSQELAARLKDTHPVETGFVETNGSLENRRQLLSGRVDLAPMQETAIGGGRDLCLVAPLFYEVVFALAKVGSEIESIDDFRGKHVAVGPQGSGSRATAELVFESLNLTPELVSRDVGDWRHLFDDDAPEAAMICMGRGSELIAEVLASGRWKLIPIKDANSISLQHPKLVSLTIRPEELGDPSASRAIVPTVGTTAFLAARSDTPSELVTAALEALYSGPQPFPHMIPRHTAVEWLDSDFHPAAIEFFQSPEVR